MFLVSPQLYGAFSMLRLLGASALSKICRGKVVKRIHPVAEIWRVLLLLGDLNLTCGMNYEPR
jgi:hypothetical protein